MPANQTIVANVVTMVVTVVVAVSERVLFSDCFRRRAIRPATILVLLTFLGSGLLQAMSGSAAAASKPNIVFVLIDDMGFMDIACNGSRFHETPQIDRLAAQGMRFTDGYAACPVCSPTRFSIMSGKYPARGHLTNFIAGNRWPDNSPLKGISWQPYMLPAEFTIAEALKSAGYQTGCFGKWHLNTRGDNNRGDNTRGENSPLARQTQPEAQGFDVVVGRVENQTDKSAAGLTEAAVRFMKDNQDKPFFVYLCHHSVHIPLEATPDLIEKYEKRILPGDPQNNPTYAGMVECVDRSIGRIMATLDELALTEETLVVFFSDNGGLNVLEGRNTPATSNHPYRDGKGYVHEGGIRVPLIVRWPKSVPAGTTCSVPVSSVDFYPTFLEMVDVKPQPGQILDGVSLLPLLTQSGTLERDAIYWHYPHYSNQGSMPAGAVRSGDFKLVENYEDGSLELYNLIDDREEQNNLAATMPEKTAELRQRLDDWRKSVDAQMPAGNPDFDPAKPRYSEPKQAPESWRQSGEPPLRSAAE